jgi:hypothetical protein
VRLSAGDGERQSSRSPHLSRVPLAHPSGANATAICNLVQWTHKLGELPPRFASA